jgi:calcineurin-like phosphoesterase
MDVGSVIFKMKTKMPGKFKCAEGTPFADAVIFEINGVTKKVTSLKRIKF